MESININNLKQKTFNKSEYIKNCFNNSMDKRFNDDNPSVYLWLENGDSRINLIDKDDIIELKIKDYDNIVITNCGFLVFLKNRNIKAIYDLFETKTNNGNSDWKSLIPDFSFFYNYNYITSPLNCRRIYIKEGKLDTDKVKKYNEIIDNQTYTYYNINADLIGIYYEYSVYKGNFYISPVKTNGFFELSIGQTLTNYISFYLKPFFKIRFFNIDGTQYSVPTNITEYIKLGNNTENTKIIRNLDGTLDINIITYNYSCTLLLYDNTDSPILQTPENCYDQFLTIDINKLKDFTGYIEVL